MNSHGESSLGALKARLTSSGVYGVAASVSLLSLACPAAAWGENVGPVLAWALTFGPGAGVMILASKFSGSRYAFTGILLSTMLRLGVAGVGGLVVLSLWPLLPQTGFLLWLAAMYVIALAVEVYLLLPMAQLGQGFRVLLEQDDRSRKLPEAGR